MQESSLPWDVMGFKSSHRPNNLEKFMVELRTIVWADPASGVGMPGSQVSGGWKCALVNYCHMRLLLVIAKESRYTGPRYTVHRASWPIALSQKGILCKGEEFSQRPVQGSSPSPLLCCHPALLR